MSLRIIFFRNPSYTAGKRLALIQKQNFNVTSLIYHTFCLPGHYISFDDLPSSKDHGYTARFDVPLKFSSSYTCIKFHYHMWGVHVGRLNVYSNDLHGNEKLLWRLFGDQNNTWKEASVPVNVFYLQYQVNLRLYTLAMYKYSLFLDLTCKLCITVKGKIA